MSIYTGTRYDIYECVSQFVVKSSQGTLVVGLRDRVAIIRTLISPPLILTRALGTSYSVWRGLVEEEGRRFIVIVIGHA